VQGEAGILGNVANPSQGLNGAGFNFGQLYTDHANSPMLNQILMTATKPVDATATGYSFGFTGQALYGSNIRVNHYLGIDTFSMAADRDQINFAQGFLAAHLPLLAAGGVDVKLGPYVSPQGRESLDPSGNPFHSRSDIDNYGTTFNHTGILTTTHVNTTLDLNLGLDTGDLEHDPIKSERLDRQDHAQAFVERAISCRPDDSIRSESALVVEFTRLVPPFDQPRTTEQGRKRTILASRYLSVRLTIVR
jgi:hypothetical protein